MLLRKADEIAKKAGATFCVDYSVGHQGKYSLFSRTYYSDNTTEIEGKPCIEEVANYSYNMDLINEFTRWADEKMYCNNGRHVVEFGSYISAIAYKFTDKIRLED